MGRNAKMIAAAHVALLIPKGSSCTKAHAIAERFE
jgi:hypothetical protein